MKRRGFSVDIVTYEDQSPKLFFPLEDGINLVNLDDFDARPRLDDEGPEVKRKRVSPGSVYQWLVDRRPLARSLRDHVKRSGIDVLIPFLPPAMATAAVASFGMRTPLIASTHNDPRRDFSRKKWSRDAVDVWVRKRALTRMTSILVLLPEYRKWYPPKLRSRLRVVGNPVSPVPTESLTATERKKVIISVGRLTDVKRHDLLLKVWADLVDEFPDWRVRIYGLGPERPELDKRIERLGLQRVKLVGVTKRIQNKYLSASILCHPSKYEGFPLVVTEALAAGLPVVGFKDCSGLNALVEDGVNGLLVSKKNRRKSLADGLRRLMRDEELRNRMSATAPATMAPYAPKIVYDQWEAVINEAVGRH